eukprot:4542543-Pleurochrysis_carterae.AAC.1
MCKRARARACGLRVGRRNDVGEGVERRSSSAVRGERESANTVSTDEPTLAERATRALSRGRSYAWNAATSPRGGGMRRKNGLKTCSSTGSTPNDGVDVNRNFGFKWAYDN